MLTKELLLQYEKEVQYQKHMLENLGRWFTLLLALAGTGVVLTYFFHQGFFPLFLLGILLIALGLLGMLLFGYGIYKGRLNLHKLIDLVEMEASK
jgi:vacuolar-type H+-ATPase subunit I/STV1